MSAAVAYKKIPRVSPAVLEALRGIPVADLHDEMSPGDRGHRTLSHSMRPVLPGKTFLGQAVTAYCPPGDNLMMHAALFVAERGDVLVVSNGGLPHGALWGGNATIQAAYKGIAAVVVDGPIRDLAQIRESDFGVWSTSISVSRPGKAMAGRLNTPILCAGAIVRPGDIVVGDEDGVIVLAPSDAERLATRARARIERDLKMRSMMATGATLFQRLEGAKALAAAGVDLQDVECPRDFPV
jgi:4-hydroxy-4-methyl-2-oxoglutarate aldolase